MAAVLINDAEKKFIIDGVEVNMRNDGRTCNSYRPMELECDIVSTANGSARLRLANSDILVGVKTEIDTPHPDSPNHGKIEFFVDCSANATPVFEGRGGEDLATEISNSLSKAYYSSFPLDKLSIVPRQMCWKLYVDILILELGGNLFDATSLAVKAALDCTRIPRVTTAAVDGKNIDLQLSDDPHDCWTLDISHIPCLVTMCKIGDHYLVDPTQEEEACSNASLILAITKTGKLTSMFKYGDSSLHYNSITKILKTGVEVGKCLNAALDDALARESRLGPKRKKFGFLFVN
ncbi:hypothetical protein M8J76_005213 [Diaphorina citri]|nr:hypothetical protein M8J76_005213 [Diaphorina citri]